MTSTPDETVPAATAPAAPAQHPVARRVLRRTARLRLIAIAPLLAVLALSAWALASPVGASPDDDFHLTSVWCSNEARTDLCAPTDSATERLVPDGVLKAGCYIGKPDVSAECQNAVLARPQTDKEQTDRGNFVGGYPPVYYAVMNLFAGPNVAVSALLMRFVTIVLFVALASVLYALLPRRRHAAFTWGWLVSTVPLGLFIIPSNNPSSWAVIGVGLGWLALLGWYESDGRRKVGLGVVFAVATIMAAGARSDAAIYAVLGMLVAGVLSFARTRRFLLNSLLPLAFVAVCALSVLTSQQSLSAVNGFGGAPAAGEQAPSVFGLLAYNLLNVPSLWAGTLGTWALGWFDTGLPAIVSLASIGGFVAVGFVGFGRLTRAKALALAGVGFVLIALPVYVLTAGGDQVGSQVQPRYLLPAMVILAGVLALPAGQRLVRFTRGQLVLVIGSLAVAQFVALHTTMRRYITGTDEQSVNLNAGIEWWWSIPFSPMVVLVVGTLAYTGLVAILAVEANGRRSQPEQLREFAL